MKLATLPCQEDTRQLVNDVINYLPGASLCAMDSLQSSRCTHLITQGIVKSSYHPFVITTLLRGAYVVDMSWVNKSIENGKWSVVSKNHLVFDQFKSNLTHTLLDGMTIGCDSSATYNLARDMIRALGGKIFNRQTKEEKSDFVLGDGEGCVSVQDFVSNILHGKIAPSGPSVKTKNVEKKPDLISLVSSPSPAENSNNSKTTKADLIIKAIEPKRKRENPALQQKDSKKKKSAIVDKSKNDDPALVQSNSEMILTVSGMRSEGYCKVLDMMNRVNGISNERKARILDPSDDFAPDVTHVIVPSRNPLRTIKVMNGIASGAWIVHEDWLKKSLAAGKWLDESSFEARTAFPICEMMRQRRQSNTIKDNGLLQNISIFIDGKTKAPRKVLKHLIQSTGGSVVQSAGHAKYVLQGDHASTASTCGDSKCVLKPEKWLFDLFQYGWRENERDCQDTQISQSGQAKNGKSKKSKSQVPKHNSVKASKTDNQASIPVCVKSASPPLNIVTIGSSSSHDDDGEYSECSFSSDGNTSECGSPEI